MWSSKKMAAVMKEIAAAHAIRSGGAPIDDSGKYITIYQAQRDGTWLMARDIWNSDRSLPGA